MASLKIRLLTLVLYITVVEWHVKRLREKLEGVSDKWELKTVWSVGYKFETKD